MPPLSLPPDGDLYGSGVSVCVCQEEVVPWVKRVGRAAAVGQLAAGMALTVGLVTHAQDDLWGAVIAGHHIRGHEQTGGCCPGQAEIEDLQGAIRFHYDVTGLQILQKIQAKNTVLAL